MKIIIFLFVFVVYGCAEYSPPDNFSCSGKGFPAKWDDGDQIYKIVDGDITMSHHPKDGSKQEIVFKLSQDGFDYQLTFKKITAGPEHKIFNDQEIIIKLVKLPEDVNEHEFVYHTYAMSFSQGADTKEGYCLGYKSSL